MTVQDLINQVRYQINDLEGIEFSDAELINYINQGQDYISQTAINYRFKGLVKQADLSLSNGKATLPSDFVKEHKVKIGGRLLRNVAVSDDVDSYSYKIIGNEIFSSNDTITLYYFYMYPSYSSLSDQLQIPRVFENLLREIVIYLALNRTNINTSFEVQLSQLYEDRIRQIISQYGNSNIERPMPFVV